MDILCNFNGIEDRITDISVAKFNIFATRKFSFGAWSSRQHAFLRLQAGGHSGYGENVLSVNLPDKPLSAWCASLRALKGQRVCDALHIVREHIGVWEDRVSEAAEMALIDLAGKLSGKDALSLLDLPAGDPVPGVYVILHDDPSIVTAQTRIAVELGLHGFIKVKLFGERDVDNAIIDAVRSVCKSSDTYLIGDVNGGYRKKTENPVSTAHIAQHLLSLREHGLDACEDPAYLCNAEWVALQEQVGTLALIPDYPMRPAALAARTILHGMGKIYNIHPGCTASLVDALTLARGVREMGAKLMIGDDSLIGPGCTVWQQLAMGLHADWVEAVEKVGESDFYLEAADLATKRTGGTISRTPRPGFGAQINWEKLCASAAQVSPTFVS